MEQFIFAGKVARFNGGCLMYEGSRITGFKSVKECREYLQGLTALTEEVPAPTPARRIRDTDIALTLSEHGEVKPSAFTVSHFRHLAERKLFFPANSLLELRLNYPVEAEIISEKIEYLMRDGSSVLLDIETNRLLNNTLTHTATNSTISAMTESSATFVNMVSRILADTLKD